MVTDARNAATEVQSWGASHGGDYSGLNATEVATIKGNVQLSTGDTWQADPASAGGGQGFTLTIAGPTGTNPVTYDSTAGGIQ